MTQNHKQKKAVALTYNNMENPSPKVSASGRGITAENIIDVAKEHGVPVKEDETLVELLSKLHVSEVIPEELYQAVAEVFAFIYKVDQQYKKSKT
jgi:flagellar biosynthesis protein